MATFTVNTTADVVDGDLGQLSLREALALADVDSMTPDRIEFAPTVQGGRIVLAGSQLTASSDVTIDGGAGVTIDADQASRVLLVQGDETDVTLAHLTIAGGKTTGNFEGGGGILVTYGTLALDCATVSGNSTAGFGAYGGGILGRHLTLTNSTVSGNSTEGLGAAGGGIEGYSVTLANSTVSGNRTTGESASGGGIAGLYVTLTNSTVSGNSTTSGTGGGIYSQGHITLSNSTVSGNSTEGDYGLGGGIYGLNFVALTNSTVTGNSTAGGHASGGGIAGGNYMTLTNSTVSSNSAAGEFASGGGIHGFYVGLANSIVAGNTTPDGTSPDVAVYTGSIESNGLNIFGSDVAGSLPSDRENVSSGLLFAALDPLIGGGQLGDNGGPIQTIALRDAPNNPALGRADPETAPPTDQRGEPRPEPTGTAPDIGAFELDQSNPSPPPVGTTFVITTASDITADDGQLTLREALALADADNLTKDRIEFAADAQGQTITLAGSALTANSDVTIDGGAGVTIDADQASRVLLVQGFDTDVSLQHLAISGGRTTADNFGQGGGIRAGRYTTLALDHTTVSGNSTEANGASGGGIYAFNVVTLTDSTVTGNSTTGESASGGGIYGRSVTLAGSTVSGNSTVASSDGGGIYGRSVTLSNSTVNGNAALGGFGGGINGYSVTLTNSTVNGNTASVAYGGGISGSYVTLSNSIVADNDALSGAPDVFASITTSNGHNIFGSDVDGSVSGDLENVPASLLFAGGLADNGGPTQTIALRDIADNPALGGGDPTSSPATDQRGEVRPQPLDTAPDIGAFELNQTGGPLNEIVGTARGECLRGTTGADLMRALEGDDRLWGRAGDDQLFGGKGCDVLAGNLGIDRTTGGPGADRFLFHRPVHAVPDGAALDTILDFTRAQHDRIDVRPIDAKAGAHGNQAFRFIGAHDFTHPGQLRYEATTDGDFLVSGNVDRDLDADFAFIVRTGLARMEAADFLL